MNLSDLARLPLEQRIRLEQLLLATQPDRETDQIIRSATVEGPLSWAQQGVWLTQQLAPDTSAYNLALHTRWIGTVDPESLQSALRAVVGRHEVLRTGIHLDDDGLPYQRIVSMSGCP
jgi:hypothetical protein